MLRSDFFSRKKAAFRSHAKPALSRQPPVQCYFKEKIKDRDFLVSENRDLAVLEEERPQFFWGTAEKIREMRDWFESIRYGFGVEETGQELVQGGKTLREAHIVADYSKGILPPMADCSSVGAAMGGDDRIDNFDLVFRDSEGETEEMLSFFPRINTEFPRKALEAGFHDLAAELTYLMNRETIKRAETAMNCVVFCADTHKIDDHLMERKRFEYLLSETDSIDRQSSFLGLNQHACPKVGEGYLQYGSREFAFFLLRCADQSKNYVEFLKREQYNRGVPVNPREPMKVNWNLHWANVVAVSGNDRLTYEYAEPNLQVFYKKMEAFRQLYFEHEDFRGAVDKLIKDDPSGLHNLMPATLQEKYFLRIAKAAKNEFSLGARTVEGIDHFLSLDFSYLKDKKEVPGFFRMYGKGEQSFYQQFTKKVSAPNFTFVVRQKARLYWVRDVQSYMLKAENIANIIRQSGFERHRRFAAVFGRATELAKEIESVKDRVESLGGRENVIRKKAHWSRMLKELLEELGKQTCGLLSSEYSMDIQWPVERIEVKKRKSVLEKSRKPQADIIALLTLLERIRLYYRDSREEEKEAVKPSAKEDGPEFLKLLKRKR
ncbi:MAG: hypothetical protein MI784_03240 [Cytophagales bacterium]|nr:hypothetical protein [Cytophagales bacterium]